MPLTFGIGREELSDPRVECEKSHPMAHSGSEQPCISDLPVSENASGATAHHVFEAEVHRQLTMLGVFQVSKEKLGDIGNSHRATGKGGLCNHSHKGGLR